MLSYSCRLGPKANGFAAANIQEREGLWGQSCTNWPSNRISIWVTNQTELAQWCGIVNRDIFRIELWCLKGKVTGFSRQPWCLLITDVSFCFQMINSFCNNTSGSCSALTLCWIYNEPWSWHPPTDKTGPASPHQGKGLVPSHSVWSNDVTSQLMSWYLSSSRIPSFSLPFCTPFITSRPSSLFTLTSLFGMTYLLIPGSNSAYWVLIFRFHHTELYQPPFRRRSPNPAARVRESSLGTQLVLDGSWGEPGRGSGPQSTEVEALSLDPHGKGTRNLELQ